ncbi:MAG: hypothetical protein O3C21_15400 [Verrucomicrobia bacterium]|nr:hypothetical protein [Verrucomicrobiota bacterium]
MKAQTQPMLPILLKAILAVFAIACIAATVQAEPVAPRKKIALIGTEVRTHSHAQHFIDRLLVGKAWNGTWQAPTVDLVSLYIDQFPESDLARATAQRHGVPIYESIEKALTLGGDTLAVDGVVIIAEHGEYPKNEKGQTLYPRYKFFKEIVQVFEKSGRSVPVFNDKHLSTDWHECVEMVEDSKRLKFAFFAGSSLPVTWRLPAIDLPLGTPLKESVCVAYGGVDSYDFHGLETAQCMSERRKGGESGIKLITALRGAAMWEKAAASETTQQLIVSAISRSHTLPVTNGYLKEPVSFDWARRTFPDAYGYFIEHSDGFRTTLVMLPIQDFNYAGLNAETGEVYSCQMYLPMPGHSATTADFFNPLVEHIEQMVITGKVPYPAERTLLTSGMTLGAVESLHTGAPVDTPEMNIRYQVPERSTFWNN